VKKVLVRFSPEAEEVYKYLNGASQDSKTERSILNAVNKKIELIKDNFQYGDPISKNKIPNEYKINYGITNLFRIELPSFWRMLYSIGEGESQIEIIAFVLDIIDHKEYNRKFGYKE